MSLYKRFQVEALLIDKFSLDANRVPFTQAIESIADGLWRVVGQGNHHNPVVAVAPRAIDKLLYDGAESLCGA